MVPDFTILHLHGRDKAKPANNPGHAAHGRTGLQCTFFGRDLIHLTLLGSLQQKRGRVEGLDQRGTGELVRAFVPLAEVFGYMNELRSATKGHGNYTMEFLRFGEAPAKIQVRFGLAETVPNGS